MSKFVQKEKKIKQIKKSAGFLASVFCFLFLFFAAPQYNQSSGLSLLNKAQAQCAFCACVNPAHSATRAFITAQHDATQLHIETQFELHREQFIVLNFFKQHVMSGMMHMTEQLVSAAMGQMFMIGAFFDADINLDAQRDFQELTAKAHKDYQPSMQMCTIGTMGKSLGASHRRGEFNAFALSQGMLDRQALSGHMASAGGAGLDSISRWEVFKRQHCDDNDNAREMIGICNAIVINANVNADIDYGRTVDYPLTIDANFTNTTINDDETNVFALSSNLYGFDLMDFRPDALFSIPVNQPEFMRVRSVLAKRSVAQNSFAAIVGMKSSGADGTFQLRTQYMRYLMEQLGITTAGEYTQMLGGRPSYHAQMEILTKKIYQRPAFYTNLYDKPANIDRTRAAMRAISLMQNMDMYNSRLRSEMLLSVAAELELVKEQDRIQRIMPTRTSGIKNQ